MLRDIGVPYTLIGKPGYRSDPIHVMEEGLVDLVINVPRGYGEFGRPDAYLIRRQALDLGLPLITDRQLARALIEAPR